jgi:hypothetical protein
MAIRVFPTICRYLVGRVAASLLLSACCGTCMGAPAREETAYHVDPAARAVELARGVNHMSVVSDARAVPLIVDVIKGSAETAAR